MYKNIIESANEGRLAYKEGIDAFLNMMKERGYHERESFFPAENLPSQSEEYRSRYVKMLGLDNISSEGAPAPVLTELSEDDDTKIFRTSIYITKEIPQLGLLLVPKSKEKTPLVIAQHGGGGTPELCADMNGENSYGNTVKRLLSRGASVFLPQLLLWNTNEEDKKHPCHKIPYNREETDKELKRYGMSITALEIRGIMNAITFLSSLPFIDGDSIAMTGVSYGGYFTLYTMAADTRIKAGYSNACFNDRNSYPWQDLCYPNSANTFHDAEVSGLCAPRKLYVSVGKSDGVFDYKGAINESLRAKKYFNAWGCPENFVFSVWDGGHTVPPIDDGFDFLFSAFKKI